jgi:hypothetical protein
MYALRTRLRERARERKAVRESERAQGSARERESARQCERARERKAVLGTTHVAPFQLEPPLTNPDDPDLAASSSSACVRTPHFISFHWQLFIRQTLDQYAYVSSDV